ncbi:MAG: ATP-binding protein [Clostridia bacterium]|nr:ATP-binding protein [Clostridia bacterium]
MKELSLNILDIAENSVKAKATLTEILLDETDNRLTLTIKDNGCGMTAEILANVTDPFCTTRTTRKVGLGLPFLKLQAEQTGGNLKIASKYIDDFPQEHGTTVTATFNKNHIDYTPLGDVVSSIITLIHGHPDTDFLFLHKLCSKEISLDTRQVREILGDIPLNSFEVIKWIEEYLKEQYSEN